MTCFQSDRRQRWGKGRSSRRRDWAYRRARARAGRRADLFEELIKYALVCGLLLIFVRPVGVIVALVWGWKLFRRYSDLEIIPELRRHWTERELRRHDMWPDADEEIEPDPDPPSSLVQRLGDDPGAPGNLEFARNAIEHLEEFEESELGPFERGRARRSREVRVSEVVEAAVESLRSRLERSGTEVRLDLDSEAVLWADPELLQRVVNQLLESALDALEGAETPEPRLEVLAGENLAGTEVWLRIRHNGPPAEPEHLHRIIRPFYLRGDDGRPPEFALTFDKGRPGPDGLASDPGATPIDREERT